MFDKVLQRLVAQLQLRGFRRGLIVPINNLHAFLSKDLSPHSMSPRHRAKGNAVSVKEKRSSRTNNATHAIGLRDADEQTTTRQENDSRST